MTSGKVFFTGEGLRSLTGGDGLGRTGGGIVSSCGCGGGGGCGADTTCFTVKGLIGKGGDRCTIVVLVGEGLWLLLTDGGGDGSGSTGGGIDSTGIGGESIVFTGEGARCTIVCLTGGWGACCLIVGDVCFACCAEGGRGIGSIEG